MSHVSLICKIKDQQKSHKRKNPRAKPELLLTGEDMTKLIRHFPQTSESLATYLSKDKMQAFGSELLKILNEHKRDQKAFTNALLEMQAFSHGGRVGMLLLNKVYRRILEEFKMVSEINEIFKLLNFYTHFATGELKRKAFKSADEEDTDHCTKRARSASVRPASNSSSQDY